jgi:3'(2'), 5'-bisphosphate nucleotidase
MNHINYLAVAVKAAVDAGKAILDVYQTDFKVDYKEDQSPLTLADKAAHEVISAHIAEIGIPVLSEEGKALPYAVRRDWHTLWIVDPLDGTKEFVKRNGEFTVNIALVTAGQPILGVVFAPVREVLYFALQGLGAYKIDQMDAAAALCKRISLGEYTGGDLVEHGQALPLNQAQDTPYTIVGSRSHATEALEAFVEEKRSEYGTIDFIPAGSSLKLCLVAEGRAHIYPRLAPTMEWDTAAGHAVVACAGARIYSHATGEALQYNKEDLLNPWFIAER